MVLHLERTGLDQALPELLEKTLLAGLEGGGPHPRAAAASTTWDGWLWSYRDDSFLPHAPADEPGAARQPILLTLGQDNLNAADALFLVDGADPGELAGYARCVVLFDGADAAQLAVARAQWSAVKAKGHPVSYLEAAGPRLGEAGVRILAAAGLTALLLAACSSAPREAPEPAGAESAAVPPPAQPAPEPAGRRPLRRGGGPGPGRQVPHGNPDPHRPGPAAGGLHPAVR